MRDLRAELRNWREGIPVEWQPVEGDILVGFVRDDPPIDWTAGTPESVVVSEEKTGMPLTVKLDSEQLAALFELHNPRGSDRIGIKCTGAGGFMMMMDRGTASSDGVRPSSDGLGSDSPDDCRGATPEERDFIERMLSDEMAEQDAYDCPAAQGPKIAGVIRREEQGIARQTRGLEILESVINQSPSTAKEEGPGSKPASKRNWFRVSLIVIVLLVACTVGVGYSLGYRAIDVVDMLRSLSSQ